MTDKLNAGGVQVYRSKNDRLTALLTDVKFEDAERNKVSTHNLTN